MVSQSDTRQNHANPALKCDCANDPERVARCHACGDTGRLIEWRCEDCGHWFCPEDEVPDPDFWEWARERYCERCANGQKLDGATALVRKLAKRLKPAADACRWGPNPVAELVAEANSFLLFVGEEPL